ncbi:delta endotoxin C-terminal domain-containing protein [Runella slithyformis]|uniref:Pesticidal crystal protein domain-containing protein n=1 Tax=Runella slithyformis (strain ATCC 29530 / DSM 19594 / LMG 11500 / NCIMB 11436 / LSU 4) TaxID=761193 RepID=A0A7U3ZLJ6_RUNSL|nr:delta endotoxin C-terminal domain-containing protein [Runella slithyformis]AEI49437.1 hypothetical protein Runsl_3053 [Runella slithyformis DSM 19594]
MKNGIVFLAFILFSCNQNEDITKYTSTFNANDIVLENEDFVITSDKDRIRLNSNQVISFSFSMDSTNNENVIFDKLVFVPSDEQIKNHDLSDTVAVKFNNGAKLNLHEILKKRQTL